MAKQRIIAITGASGGLAQEIVKQLSPSDGIILLGRDKDKLEKCYRHVENKTCLAIDLRDDNASMAGKIATANSSVYAATKFAVIGFSDALRLELADKGVYVTTVNPGPIETSFFDQADPSGAYLESVKKFVLSPKYVAKKIIRILGKTNVKSIYHDS